MGWHDQPPTYPTTLIADDPEDGNAGRGCVTACTITVVTLFALYGAIDFCITLAQAVGWMPLP